eukprot:COSAG04_NODE_321_length_16881_cov_18.146347_5_plen_313_part_00
MADAAGGSAQPGQPEPAPSAPSQPPAHAKTPPERPLPTDELPEPEGGRWEALPALVQEVVQHIVQETEAQNAAAEQPARPVAASGGGGAAAGERGTKRACTALADIPASQRTRDGILQMRLADGSAFRCDEASPVEEQVREAKRWMHLTGASATTALSLTHDGAAAPRAPRGAQGGQAKYVWPKLTIGRVRARWSRQSQWHGLLLMPPEKRQAIVHRALEKNLDRYRLTGQELQSIAVDVLRSIPPEERSLRAQEALAKADGGAKRAISAGWISNLRKAMKVEPSENVRTENGIGNPPAGVARCEHARTRHG